jgi:hypothetical protein
MLIQDFVTLRAYRHDEPTYVNIDPRVQFAYVVGEGGEPERVMSSTRILVPMFDWELEDENDIILRVMNEASKSNLLRVQTFDDLTPAFWVKRRFHLSAFAMHPSNEGRAAIPERTVVFYTEGIEPNRVVCIGPKDRAGTLLLQEGEESVTKGYIVNAQSLLSILVSSP